MKYDERTCKFNMDTGCVELLLRDGRMISMDYLIYNDPLGYADLILNGDLAEYLKNKSGSRGLED